LQLPDVEVPANESKDPTCFDIQHIDITGAEVFSAAQMHALSAPYLNKCLGLSHISQLIKTISNLYIAAGLVTSRAFLQPQNLADGRLAILVVEGKLEQLEARQNALSERQLRWVFPVKTQGLVNLRDLEQGLEQLNRLQQNHSEMDIQPGSATGTSRIFIRNQAATAWHYGAGVNNSGSEATGKNLATAYVSWDNATNSNDNLYLNFSDALASETPAKSRSYSMAYSLPYGYSLFSYAGSSFEYQQLVEGVAVSFITRGASANHSLSWDYMAYRGQRDKLGIGMSFSRKQSKNYLEDVFLDTSSRVLYMWEVGPSYTRHLNQGVLNSSFKWYRSVNWWGAKEKLVSAESDFQFNKYTLDSSVSLNFDVAEQPLSYQSSLSLFYAPQNIIASEGLTLGGRYSIRGMEGDGLFGYSGGYWRNQVTFIHPLKLGGHINFYAGIDLGRVDDRASVPASVAGSAVGIVLAVAGINFDVAYARALRQPDYVSGPEHALYANLQINF
jgi:hemolysin activation/secretion protein